MDKETKDKVNTDEINEKNQNNCMLSTKKHDKHSKSLIKKYIAIMTAGVLCVGIGFVGGKEVGRRLPATHKSYSNKKVVATVGDSKITGEQLKNRMEPVFYLNGKRKMTTEEVQAYEASMIDYMTTTEMLYLKGNEENIKVTEDEVTKEYDSLMDSIKEKFSMSEEEFLEAFNFTKKLIKSEVKKEAIATKYLAKASEVKEDEAKNYYDRNKEQFAQVRASHILLKTVDDTGNALSKKEKSDKKLKANEVLKKVKNGEDFSSLAKKYSEDNSSSKGGDVGYFSKGQMVEVFENEAFKLKIGDVSKSLIESDYGYHIIKKTGERYENFNDIKDDLIYRLSYEKQGNIVDNLVEEYNVKINK